MIRYDNRYDTLGQPLGTPDQEGARERGKILIVVAGRCGSRGPQGRITTVVFQFGLGDDWLKGAKMVRELEGTISTPQVGSLELKKLKELVDVVNHVK